MEGNETLRGKRKSAVLSFTPLFLTPPFCSTAVNTHFHQPPRPATLGLLVRAGLITMIKVWWETGLILFPRQTASHQRFLLLHLVGIFEGNKREALLPKIMTRNFFAEVLFLVTGRYTFDAIRLFLQSVARQDGMQSSPFPSSECGICPHQVQDQRRQLLAS